MTGIVLENPVRVRLDEVATATGDFHRLDALIAAFEILVRFDALVLANGMVRDGSRIPALAMARLRHHSISLGDWLMLVEVLSPLQSDGAELHGWLRRQHTASGGSLLHRMIAIRNDRAHGERRADPRCVAKACREVEGIWERVHTDHPPHESLIACIDGSLLLGDTGRRVTGPFLHAALDAEPAQILLFAGRRRGSFIWTSPRGLERALDAKSSSLLDTGGIALAVDCRPTLGELRDRIDTVTSATLRQAVESRRYRPPVTVARSELEEWMQRMLADQARVVLIDGPELAGKTTALCRFVESMLAVKRPVLFLSCRDLAHTLEAAVGAVLGCPDDPRSALTRLASTCPSGELLLVIDDLGLDPRGTTASAESLGWLSKRGQPSPIRTIAAGRSDHIRPLLTLEVAGHTPWIRAITIPPLRRHELLALAERLDADAGTASTVRVLRRSTLASRIAASREVLVRRAGISALLLERNAATDDNIGFCLVDVYRAVMRHEVLDTMPDGRPRHPSRGVILESLAQSLAERGDEVVPWAAIAPRTLPHLRHDHGDRTPAFQTLLDLGILSEDLHGFGTYLRFLDSRMAAYCLAAPLDVTARMTLLGNCLPRITEWSLASHVVAMCIATTDSSDPILAEVDVSAIPAGTASGVLSELAMLSPEHFALVFKHTYAVHPVAAMEFIENLLHTGQAALARRAAQAVETEPPRSHVDLAMRLLRVRSYYECDDYEAVRIAVSAMSPPISPEVRAIEADTLATIDYRRALAAWQRLMETIPSGKSTIRGICLRGMGYAFLRLGRLDDAKLLLTQALPVLQGRYRNRYYSEALGELAEVHMGLGELDEAEVCLDRSWKVSSDACFTTALGIIEGQKAMLSMARGRLEEAESRFYSSLRVHEMVDNLWRQAWTYKNLASLYQRMERDGDQLAAIQQCEGLCRALGINGVD